MTLAAVAQDAEWSAYGQDPGGQRFAEINQIHSNNVHLLKQAWVFQTNELDRYKNEKYLMERAAFEATPLMVKGKLFLPTPSNILFALDASTGKELWRFDPGVDLFRTEFSELTCRGVSYWEKDQQERLLMGTVDGRLFSIDAITGHPDQNFGSNGFVDFFFFFYRSGSRWWIFRT